MHIQNKKPHITITKMESQESALNESHETVILEKDDKPSPSKRPRDDSYVTPELLRANTANIPIIDKPKKRKVILVHVNALDELESLHTWVVLEVKKLKAIKDEFQLTNNGGEVVSTKTMTFYDALMQAKKDRGMDRVEHGLMMDVELWAHISDHKMKTHETMIQTWLNTPENERYRINGKLAGAIPPKSKKEQAQYDRQMKWIGCMLTGFRDTTVKMDITFADLGWKLVQAISIEEDYDPDEY
jgi:hypothetical protein